MTKQNKIRKFVFERSPIEAWAIFNSDNLHVANVHKIDTQSSTTIDIWHTNGTQVQQGKATGYGYNRFNSALAGLEIDGYTMYDDCETNDSTKALLETFKADTNKAKRSPDSLRGYDILASILGAKFANNYHNVYLLTGFDVLSASGYSVIKVL